MTPGNDTIDLREVASTLRREKRWVFGGVAAGLAIAAAIAFLAKPSYRASATALLRSSTESAPSALAMLGGLAGGLPGGMPSAVETELQLLTSRTVYGAVVDSLDLQAIVVRPAKRGVQSLIETAEFEPVIEEAVYSFRRVADGYAVEGPNHRGTAVPGRRYDLPGAWITLRAELPDQFKIEIVSREEAIDRLQDDLGADEAGGDVARLIYTADDPITAAAVPNLVIEEYLRRKRTTDRGVNQYKYEFLRSRTDSVTTELLLAAEALRRAQEESGVLDPVVSGEAEIESEMLLRSALETVRIDLRALGRLLGDGSLNGRDVAAFPTLLASPAVNDMVSQLAQLETARDTLLDRRTPRDSTIIVLSNRINSLERQLEGMARSHLASLQEQEAEIVRELQAHEGALAALPQQAQENLSRQRDVERLTQTELILQTQLIDARLAAITEGGEYRQIDVAVPPEEPHFPRPVPTFGIGLLAGLMLGVVSALGAGYFGQKVREPSEVEMLTGSPGVLFDRSTPLLLGGLQNYRSSLVVPIGSGALAKDVGLQLAGTALLQGKRAVVLDLTVGRTAAALLPGVADVGVELGSGSSTALGDSLTEERPDGIPVYRLAADGAGPERIRIALEKLEAQYDLVVTVTSRMDDAGTATLLSPHRLVILVGKVGQVTRSEVREASTSLNRLGISIPGVVLTNGS